MLPISPQNHHSLQNRSPGETQAAQLTQDSASHTLQRPARSSVASPESGFQAGICQTSNTSTHCRFQALASGSTQHCNYPGTQTGIRSEQTQAQVSEANKTRINFSIITLCGQPIRYPYHRTEAEGLIKPTYFKQWEEGRQGDSPHRRTGTQDHGSSSLGGRAQHAGKGHSYSRPHWGVSQSST